MKALLTFSNSQSAPVMCESQMPNEQHNCSYRYLGKLMGVNINITILLETVCMF